MVRRGRTISDVEDIWIQNPKDKRHVDNKIQKKFCWICTVCEKSYIYRSEAQDCEAEHDRLAHPEKYIRLEDIPFVEHQLRFRKKELKEFLEVCPTGIKGGIKWNVSMERRIKALEEKFAEYVKILGQSKIDEILKEAKENGQY